MIKNIIKTSAGTMLSRILGLARDLTIALSLGASETSDIFFVAFRLPNLFRAFFAEGLNGVIIPMYSHHRHNSKKDAIDFTNRIFSFMFVLVSIICLLIYIFIPEMVSVFATGFTPKAMETTIILSRIMLPFLLFISLSSICCNVLNANQKFFLTSALSCILNVMILISQFFNSENLIYNMSLAVLFGGMIQLIVVIVALNYENHKIQILFSFKKNELKEFLSKVIPIILGSCVMQINIWVSTSFASLSNGAISYIYYADRINQLPQSLIGTAICTVLLPTIGKHIKNNNQKMANEAQQQCIELGMLFAIPATAAMMTIPKLVISGLFGYGSFNLESIEKAGAALQVLGTSLPAFVISRIILATFYANNEKKTPLKGAFLSLCSNILLNYILHEKYGFIGTSIAISASTWINAIYLSFASHKSKIIRINIKSLSAATKNIFIASSVMVAVLSILDILLFHNVIASKSVIIKLSTLTLSVISGALSYSYMIKFLSKKSLKQILKFH